MLFTFVDVSSIPHSLNENATHPAVDIDLWAYSSFLLMCTIIVLTKLN